MTLTLCLVLISRACSNCAAQTCGIPATIRSSCRVWNGWWPASEDAALPGCARGGGEGSAAGGGGGGGSGSHLSRSRRAAAAGGAEAGAWANSSALPAGLEQRHHAGRRRGCKRAARRARAGARSSGTAAVHRLAAAGAAALAASPGGVGGGGGGAGGAGRGRGARERASARTGRGGGAARAMAGDSEQTLQDHQQPGGGEPFLIGVSGGTASGKVRRAALPRSRPAGGAHVAGGAAPCQLLQPPRGPRASLLAALQRRVAGADSGRRGGRGRGLSGVRGCRPPTAGPSPPPPRR